MSDGAADLKTPATGADQTSQTTDTTKTDAAPDTKTTSGGDTMFDGDGADDKPVTTQADWPEDWRSKLAGEDDKLLKRLGRFSDPGSLMKSWLAAEQKISSGEFKKGLPENPTPEQMAEWRQQNGIPDEAAGYKPPEIDGFEWTEADKPLLDAFYGAMHEANAPQATVEAALKAYSQIIEQSVSSRVETDKAYKADQEDALRTKLGTEFRPQLNLVKQMFEDSDGPIPQGIVQQLMTARDGEGNRIINSADTMQWLIEIGLNHYGDTATMTGDARASMTSRIDEIKKIMNTDFARYKSEGLDKEYAKLLERQQGKRGASGFAYDE